MAIEIPRRRFIQGLATLFAAPAIVKASSLMPVKTWREVLVWPVPDDATSITFFGGRVFWLHPSNQMGMFYTEPGDWLNHPKASLIKMRPLSAGVNTQSSGPFFVENT